MERDIKKAVEWFKIAEINKGMTPKMISDICYTMGSIFASGEGSMCMNFFIYVTLIFIYV